MKKLYFEIRATEVKNENRSVGENEYATESVIREQETKNYPKSRYKII